MAAHHYRATCRWKGSTAGGSDAYRRTHEVTAPPAVDALELSADPAFGGDPDLHNPESLVLMAAASCQMLSFLAVAAKARLDVTDYRDEADAVMVDDWISEVRLRPRITVREPATEARVRHLCQVAHRECFVARSLRSDITVDPVVTVERAAPG